MVLSSLEWDLRKMCEVYIRRSFPMEFSRMDSGARYLVTLDSAPAVDLADDNSFRKNVSHSQTGGCKYPCSQSIQSIPLQTHRHGLSGFLPRLPSSCTASQSVLFHNSNERLSLLRRLHKAPRGKEAGMYAHHKEEGRRKSRHNSSHVHNPYLDIFSERSSAHRNNLE